MDALSTRTSPRRASVLLWGAGALALVLVGFLLGRLGAGQGVTGAGASGVDAAGGGTSLEISGSTIRELRPGTTSPIDVAVTHRGDQAVVVTDLVVEIVDLSAPQADDDRPCTPADFVLTQAPASLAVDVDARSTARLSGTSAPPATWPRIELVDRPVNQDGCQGATVTLAFTAVGRSS
ncbi:hypothetical protein Cfla_1080 [Cellulomonas flavigena DSM 20109]|uniref:Uncharacterized protein n=1 Tax=Cellulomonas flavigena (strain ATCC 482 / DSM 20109 / BCRC 11376 / JCM 18109 / NBRC 3775 / NCIMB 8073 / NRS 134) TaxID=446466 RepID=D5ULE3_CELFN|nr:hypothetical protein [Cellulomonas flavigena]ADG73985.1 hypothetical protein Cfla_1080 [Cellulomonas flavigena DSM 20109]